MASKASGKGNNNTKIKPTQASDEIVGTEIDDTLVGLGGDDTLLGGGGDDQLNGNAGNDTLDGGADNDGLNGNSGDDTLLGGSGDDRLKGNAGNDSLDGGAGSDDLKAGSGDDLATYVAGENQGATDSYDGGSGDDTLLLELTRDEWFQLDVQADIQNFLAFMEAHTDPLTGETDGESFHFSAFDLSVRKFENLRITVDGVELDPRDEAVTAQDDAVVTLTEESTVSGNVLDNDDVPDLVRSVELVEGPARGALSFNPDGSFVYDPGAEFDWLAEGETATESFTYKVTDADLDTDTATVTITVTGTNDGPQAYADTDATDEDTAISIDVLVNDTDVDRSDTHTVDSVEVTGGLGAAGIAANQVTYDPTAYQYLAEGETAAVELTYVMSDNHGAESTSTVAIVVTGTNDGPQAYADSDATNEDTAISIDVLANDTDVDRSDTHTVDSVEVTGGLGAAGIAANQVTYDPTAYQYLAEDETADVELTYVMSDNHGAESTSTVSIVVTGTNDGPQAYADTSATDEDTAISIDVLANDTDVDRSDTHTVDSVEVTGGLGAAGIAANQVTYDPTAYQYLAEGETAEVELTYVMSDNHGAESTATVAIVVTGTNDGPQAYADSDATNEDTAISIDVLANDTDVDRSDTHTVDSVEVTGGLGAASIANNQVSYDPSAYQYLAAGETAEVELTYVMSDNHGAESTSTVAITVTGTNDGPQAYADSGSVNDNETLTLDVLANDTDIDNGDGPASFSLDSANIVSGGGEVQIVDNQLSFDPGADFDHLSLGQRETVTIEYEMSDDSDAASTASVTVTVIGTNTVPVATADQFSGDEDSRISGNVLANDSDADGDDLIVVNAGTYTTASGATLNLQENGDFTYDPIADYFGDESFDYTISDGQESASATATISVQSVNDDPVAVDDGGAGAGGTRTVDFEALDTSGGWVQSGALDAYLADYGITISDVTQSLNTVFVQNQAQSQTFLASSGENYMEQASGGYTWRSYTLEFDSALDSFSFTRTTYYGATSSGIIHAEWSATAYDANGNVLGVVGQGINGAYNPISNPVPAQTYTFGGGNIASVRFFGDHRGYAGTASAGIDDLVLTGDVNAEFSTSEDTPMTILAADLLANDSDVEGDSLSIQSVGNGVGGSAALDGNGNVVFTPDADFNGDASFDYVVIDGNGGSDSATVSLEVRAVNDAPTVGADAYDGTEDSAISGNVLANDSDVDGDALSVVNAGTITTAEGGTVVLQANGDFSYTPAADFHGADSFNYALSDGTDTVVGTATFTLDSVNDGPTIDLPELTGGGLNIAVTYGNQSDISAVNAIVAQLNDDTYFDFTATAVHMYQADELGELASYDAIVHAGNYYEAMSPSYWAALRQYIDSDAGGVVTTGLHAYNMTYYLGGSSLADANYISPATPSGYSYANGTSFTLDDSHEITDGLSQMQVFGGQYYYGAPGIDANATSLGYFNGGHAVAYTEADGVGNMAYIGGDYSRSYSNYYRSGNWDQLLEQSVNWAADGGNGTSEDTALTITDIVISDVDAGDDAIEVSLSVNDGTLALNGTSGLSFSDVDGSDGTLSFSGSQAAINTALSDGLVYMPRANFNGADRLSVAVDDLGHNGSGGSQTANDSVEITVRAVNDAPVANPESVTTNEDTPITINVLGNDSDVDGDALSVTAITNVSGGSVALDANGDLVFTPEADFNGDASFTYTAGDDAGGSDTATVNVTVDAVNDAPLAADDGISDTSQTQIVDFEALDTSGGWVQGGALDAYLADYGITISDVTQSLNTVFVQNEAQSQTFLASSGENYMEQASGGYTWRSYTLSFDDLLDSFSFTRTAYYGATSSGIIHAEWSATAYDADGNALGSYGAGTHGAYNPISNPVPAQTFTFDSGNIASVRFYGDHRGYAGTASAGIDDLVLTSTVPASGEFTTNEDTAITIAAADLLANDSDADGDTLSLQSVANASGGSVALDGNGNVVFTPDADYNGDASFDYTVIDGNGGSATAAVNVTVSPVNDAPMVTVPLAEDTIVAADTVAGDGFGYATSTDGVHLAVGAYGNGGAVYVHKLVAGSWVEEAIIAGPGGNFGNTVAIDGDHLLVGAQVYGSGRVFAYEFDGANWQQTQVLGGSTSRFGEDVSISGTTMVVGGLGSNSQGSWVGRAFVYELDGAGNWILKATLYNPQPTRDDYFGRSVDIDGDTVIVGGDQGVSHSYPATGQAYVFTKNANGVWDSGTELIPTDGLTHDANYGFEVAVSGDVAVVGAGGEDENGVDSGAAYVFVRQGGAWTHVQTLIGSDIDAGDNFGYSLDVHNGTIVVGARGNEADGPAGSGSLYVFELNEATGLWQEVERLDRAEPSTSDYFGGSGYSLAVADDFIIAGNYGDQSVSVFDRLAVAEDGARTIEGFSIADSDLDEGTGEIQVTVSAGHGSVTLADTAGLVSLSGDGSHSVTLSGSLGEVNQAIASLSYRPDADFSGEDTLTVAADDLGNTGAGGALVDVQSITLTVNPVADAPIVTAADVTASAGPVEITAGAEFLVNTTTAGDQLYSNVATLADGGFLVTWVAPDGNGFGIYGQRYTAAGNANGGEFRVNSYTLNDQYGPTSTALDDGGFVITWYSHHQDGNSWGVFGQRYDANGNAAGSEFQVNSYTTDAQNSPSMATLSDGSFMVAWNSNNQDGSFAGIYVQHYDAGGNKIGGEFRVNQVTYDDQVYPDIAALPDGGYVVTWNSTYQDGSLWGAYGRVYDANGNPVTNEFQINTYTPNYQGFTNVAVVSDGGFVVTWQSLGQDGSGYGIYGQRYTADGNRIGGEFQINSYTNNNQQISDVTALTDGGFVVVWQSFPQDGGSTGIYGQRYDAAGNRVDGEFQLNDVHGGDQAQPTISALPDGGFVATWFSQSIDGSGWGISAKMFHGSGGSADTVALDISAAVGDADGSEGLASVVISGLPTGATLSAGTDDGGGAWTLEAADLSGLSLNLPSGASGEYQLTVTATAEESANGDTASSSANLTVFVDGQANGRYLTGSTGNDTLVGDSGSDTLFGLAGNDVLSGHSGSDRLAGGTGDDALDGGWGDDLFVFGANTGSDTVSDFDLADDLLLLEDGVGLAGMSETDVNGDAVLDTILALDDGGSVTLLGVNGVLDADDLFV